MPFLYELENFSDLIVVLADDHQIEPRCACPEKAADMSCQSGRSITAFPAALRARIDALALDVDVDLDAEIEGDVTL